MITFFRYNWLVRDEWFQLFEKFSHEELLQKRTGGLGSILETLFHIVDVEQAWINGLNGKPESHYDFNNYSTLQEIKALSDTCRPTLEAFVTAWTPALESKEFDVFTFGEVMRHVIVHEVHHVGQLSIWARELDKQPVTANLIGRGL